MSSRSGGSTAFLLATALVCMAAGCGGSDKARAPLAPQTVPQNTAPTKAAGAEPAPLVPQHEWSWQTTDQKGYTAKYRFAVGKPSRLAKAPLLKGFTSRYTIATTCSDFDSTTDTVLPAELSFRNTTDGFNRKVSAFFSLLPAGWDENAVRALNVVGIYGSGFQCKVAGEKEATNDQSSWSLSCQLVPDETCTTRAYILLPDYFTPAYPDGDTSLLKRVTFYVDNTTLDSIETVSAVEGPGGQRRFGVVLLSLGGAVAG